MSKRKRKKVEGMSDKAQQAMYEYAKERYEQANRVTRGVTQVGSLAFAQHCSSYAKDGFKKGYDYGRCEEIEKKFDVREIAKEFETKLKELAKSYGLDACLTHIDGHAGYMRDMSYDFHVKVSACDYDIKKAYVARKMAAANSSPFTIISPLSK